MVGVSVTNLRFFLCEQLKIFIIKGVSIPENAIFDGAVMRFSSQVGFIYCP